MRSKLDLLLQIQFYLFHSNILNVHFYQKNAVKTLTIIQYLVLQILNRNEIAQAQH